MTKYTPGPWRVGDAGATVFGPKNMGSLPKTIAVVSKASILSGQDKANAQLIASAPEMLEALKLAKNKLCIDSSEFIRVYNIIQNVIAKAEGRVV